MATLMLTGKQRFRAVSMIENDINRAWGDRLGDSWYLRNKPTIDAKESQIPALLADVGLNPKRMIEIGCGNGLHLEAVHAAFPECELVGVEPSLLARRDARERVPSASIFDGFAHDLRQFENESFDLVYLGYCLWAIPPEQWLSVAGETDRVLKNPGVLLYEDQMPMQPVRVNYKQMDAASNEYDFPINVNVNNWETLWLGHPGYRKVTETNDWSTNITRRVLFKEFDTRIPVLVPTRPWQEN